MNNNAGRVVTVRQMNNFFAEFFLKACVSVNAIKEYEKCGICLYNPDVFSKIDFVAAETTEQDENSAPIIGTTDGSVTIDIEPDTAVKFSTAIEPTITVESASTIKSSIFVESTIVVDKSSVTNPTVSTLSIFNSCFAINFPCDIIALPKISGKKTVKKRAFGTKILTSSYKNKLEEGKKQKNEQEEKQKLQEIKRAKKDSPKNKGKAKRKLTKKETKKTIDSYHSWAQKSDTKCICNCKCIFCNSKIFHYFNSFNY